MNSLISNINTPFSALCEADLYARALSLSGKKIYDLVHELQLLIPENPVESKGWLGRALEIYLGADAQNEARPDFTALGIELKTIPVDARAKPMESTYVTVVPLIHPGALEWRESTVYAKLQRVLWIPFEGRTDIPLSNRRFGYPVLWTPSVEQEAVLRADWEELMEMVVLGQLESISAHWGSVLQIRPKGANAKSLTSGIGPQGQRIKTLPRGFYLRTRFTEQILKL